jgi:hypothetical protein
VWRDSEHTLNLGHSPHIEIRAFEISGGKWELELRERPGLNSHRKMSYKNDIV